MVSDELGMTTRQWWAWKEAFAKRLVAEWQATNIPILVVVSTKRVANIFNCVLSDFLLKERQRGIPHHVYIAYEFESLVEYFREQNYKVYDEYEEQLKQCGRQLSFQFDTSEKRS